MAPCLKKTSLPYILGKRDVGIPDVYKKSDEGWDPNEDLNLELDFRHDLLDQVQVKKSLFFVNWEARGIASAWMRKKNIKIRFCEDKQCYIFIRLFNPMINVLYIAIDKINDFYIEPFDRMNEPDIYGISRRGNLLDAC